MSFSIHKAMDLPLQLGRVLPIIIPTVLGPPTLEVMAFFNWLATTCPKGQYSIPKSLMLALYDYFEAATLSCLHFFALLTKYIIVELTLIRSAEAKA